MMSYQKKYQMKKTILVFIVIMCSIGLKAEVKLPSIISNNMVLLQLSEVNLWGTASAGEKVSVNVSWSKDLYQTVTGSNGKWELKVITPSAAENQTVVIQGTNKITISNVLIGETWLCSGQSNMEYTVDIDTTEGWCLGIDDKEKFLAEANYKNIRLFHVPRNPAAEELDDCPGQWVVCTPENIKLFSSIGYIFGRKIHLETNYPVGLIESSYGGTKIEAWTKTSVIEGNPLYTSQAAPAIVPPASAPANAQRPPATAQQFPRMSEAQMEQFRMIMRPSVMWNGMINPICPYTLKGVIWYQGESNASNAKAYSEMFANMIESWRAEFGNPKLPFYFVQLAPYDEPRGDYAALREAQTIVWETVDYTGMVVITDAGLEKNVHPTNKTIPAERLALWALNRNYGQYVPCESPVFDSYYVEGNSIVVKFRYATGGLKVPAGAKELLGFTVSSNGKDFYPAKADIIAPNAIRVSALEVSKPTTVRFGYSNWLVTNLYNNAGLPVSPFRTDNN
jgi:hypothetical protein